MNDLFTFVGFLLIVFSPCIAAYRVRIETNK